METHLLLYFVSGGIRPLEIVKKLQGIGFMPAIGRYDMKYLWNKMPSAYEIAELGNKVADTLQGTNVMFKLESK